MWTNNSFAEVGEVVTEGTFHRGFQETDESCLDYGNKHGQNVRLKAHVSYLKIMKLLDEIFFSMWGSGF